jgi:hypothetical protein
MEYFYMHKRQLADEKAALNFGGGIHAGLSVRYSAPADMQDFCNDTQLEQDQLAAMDKYFEERPLPLGDFRQPDVAKNLVRAYNRRYQSEPFRVLEQAGKPLVEFPFAIKLCDMWYHDPEQKGRFGSLTWFYTGRIDLVVAEEGQIFTMDHKTTSMMGDGFWLSQRVSAQHEGYCWAWWKATGTLPSGYIVNGIRTRKPLVREADGTTKRSKRADIEPDDFQRDKVWIDLPRIQEWENNLKMMLHRFIEYYKYNYFPLHRNQCVRKFGTCQYYDVCSLASEFRLPTLSTGQFKDVTWSPLDRKTDGEVKPQVDEGPKVDWENLMNENVARGDA